MWKPAALCVCLTLSAFASAAPQATELTSTLPVVAVRLINHDPALATGMAIAQALVERLFRQAGIRVEWVDGHGPAGLGPQFTVMISPSPEAQRDKDEFSRVLGVTASGRDGERGTFARVFGDRVRAFAHDESLDAFSLLGCVITHELGHLLLPVNAHANGGIMMPIWSPRLLPPYAPIPGFLSFQADLIRLRLTDQGRLLASSAERRLLTNE